MKDFFVYKTHEGIMRYEATIKANNLSEAKEKLEKIEKNLNWQLTHSTEYDDYELRYDDTHEVPKQSKTSRGLFISFEGCDGSGKSTQVKLFSQYLTSLNITNITTREPGGTPQAEIIRNALISGSLKNLGTVSEALLFNAARYYHLKELILPQLNNGVTVITDRFSDSTIAYQSATGDPELSLIKDLEKIIVKENAPDITFILDINCRVGLQRIKDRALSSGQMTDRFDNEKIEFHEKVRNEYLKMAITDSERYCLINAEDDIITVHQNIIKKYNEIMLARSS